MPQYRTPIWTLCLLAVGLWSHPTMPEASETSLMLEADGYAVKLPRPDAERGRKKFVLSGCVLCHSVKGTGGLAAPALDAPEGVREVDPLAFSARMWAGATAMSALQAIELGVPIALTAEDIADLAAFTALASAQEGFSIAEVPTHMREWFLEAPYWENGEWPVEYKNRGWHLEEGHTE